MTSTAKQRSGRKHRHIVELQAQFGHRLACLRFTKMAEIIYASKAGRKDVRQRICRHMRRDGCQGKLDDMRRGIERTCHHVMTPILTADHRVGAIAISNLDR